MTEITIYHTNDLHNSRAVFPVLRDLPRGEGSILLDGGDALGGSNTLFHIHEPILKHMSDAGYTAMAMGNREFHYLRGVIKSRRKSMNFPLLSANLQDRSGRSSLWDEFLILKTGGVSLGLLGLTPVQYNSDSWLARLTGLIFIPPHEAVNAVVQKLKERGAEVVIALSHLGFPDDQELARNTSDLDVIIGGHSHTVVTEPIKVDDTIIVQSGCHGRYVGKLQLHIDGTDLASVSYELLSTVGGRVTGAPHDQPIEEKRA
jgi:2',3'-cyclic-nucleotide 2'-phosphodiesterase (5'-nucleotidase family)